MQRTAPIKRGGFANKAQPRQERPDRSAEFASFKLRATVPAVMARVDGPPAAPVLKDNRHESEPWRRAVAALPCVLCGRQGETQCAHRNMDKGMGLKTDDALTAALCQTCHSEIDQGKNFTREERRQRLDLAILLTIRALARAGKLRIAA